MNQTQHVDYDALNALKEVMEDDFAFLIETFLQDSSDRLATFHKLVDAGESVNSDAIRRTAHSFKGSCSNLGAVHLANLCSVIECKALEQDFGSLPADLVAIEIEFLIVKRKMKDFLS